MRTTSETAVEMQAPMWVMHVSDFVQLSRLEPHQKMLAERKITKYDPSMRHVFFVSHQWTSWDHPDHTGQQLRTFQALLRRMGAGRCSAAAPSFADAALFDASATISTAQWQEMVAADAYIWMDYFSVSDERLARVRAQHHPRRAGAHACFGAARRLSDA